MKKLFQGARMDNRELEPLYDNGPITDGPVLPMPPDAETRRMCRLLPSRFYAGCLGWGFKNWLGSVYAPQSGMENLISEGLPAYAANPMFRCVCLERNYYRPYGVTELRMLASQVPDEFRFVMRSPMSITDPMIRDRYGKPLGRNPQFLSAEKASNDYLLLAERGLGNKLGPLIFEIAPFPKEDVKTYEAREFIRERLATFFDELSLHNPFNRPLGLELRNPQLLTPLMVRLLRERKIRPVIGLHPSMPSAFRQLNAIRNYEDPEGKNSDWSFTGPMIVRWSKSAALSNTRFATTTGAEANDPATRAVIASLVLRAEKSGQDSVVLIGNRAEGSAPETIRALIEGIVRNRAR